VVCDDCREFDDMVAIACRVARDVGIALPLQKLVVTAGVPFGTPGATNILRIVRVEA
jgi:pyruvate kinase